MDCKKERHWHIVINGDNVPENKDTVVGMWVCGTETYAELCYYDPDTKEWFSVNPGTRDDAVVEPDYWIECPD